MRIRDTGDAQPDKPIKPWRKQAPVCSVSGCDRSTLALNMCASHYARNHRRPDDPLLNTPIGELKKARSQPYIDKNGYVRIRDWTTGKTIALHRKVMEEYLGRPLLPGENVHHLNGIRHDNRIENLELWSSTQPSGQRVVDKVAWARWIIETYADYVPPSESGSLDNEA